MNADQHEIEGRELARLYAASLRKSLEQMPTRNRLAGHALATALIGVGLEVALATHGPDAAKEWLRGIADEIGTPFLRDTLQ